VTHGIDTSFLVAAELKEHTNHATARSLMAHLVSRGDHLALAPQVLAEFIHVSTDQRRFQSPLDMNQARDLALKWWTAREVEQAFPTAAATQQFLDWISTYHLGRKRLLDTLLAATYLQAGITSILTLNDRDFSIFGTFQCLHPGQPTA
jgi:predicted nucleic acid-binding protein